MSNTAKYDIDRILMLFTEYLLNLGKKKVESLSLLKLYSNFCQIQSNIKIPSYDSLRKYIINVLKEYDYINDDEKLTKKHIWFLTKIYLDSLIFDIYENFEIIPLSENMRTKCENTVVYNKVYICVIEIPIFKEVVKKIWEHDNQKSKFSTYLYNKIRKICSIIKNKNQNCVIAAIPESNYIITSISAKKEYNLSDEYNPVFNSNRIILFIQNNEAGRKLIHKFRKENYGKYDYHIRRNFLK